MSAKNRLARRCKRQNKPYRDSIRRFRHAREFWNSMNEQKRLHPHQTWTFHFDNVRKLNIPYLRNYYKASS